jgi:formylglycine-generating enzyme required for sulfatase activity
MPWHDAAAKEVLHKHGIEKEGAEASIHDERERRQKEPRPGDVTTIDLGGVEMRFAWCPPGTFLMGSPAGEPERRDDEAQHEVTLTKGYGLGIHPVTQAQWQVVMGNNPSHFKGDTLPVESVSWYVWQEFVKKLGEKTGRPFRLPTEAEWEYACRAGTTTPFHFGETISTDLANYDGNHTYGQGNKGVYGQKTTPVGSFPPNAWGLYDMHGNDFEWCRDWYGPHSSSDIIDPQGANSGTARVLRGGSWYGYPGGCRSACRGGLGPGGRNHILGCRVLLCPD